MSTAIAAFFVAAALMCRYPGYSKKQAAKEAAELWKEITELI